MAAFLVDPVFEPTLAEDAGPISIHSPPPSAIDRGPQDVAFEVRRRTIGLGQSFEVDALDFTPGVDDIAPVVTAAEVIDPTTVDVMFNEDMTPGSNLLVGWAINDPLVVVQAAAQVAPFRVRLTVTEMLDGKEYVATCPSSAKDRAGNFVDPTARTATFLGVGGRPDLVAVQRITATRLRLFFSEPMRDDGDLRSPQSYIVAVVSTEAPVFVGSVQPEAVENPTYVDIDITEQTNAGDYTVDVVGVRDVAGNLINAPGIDIVGVGAPPVVARIEAVGRNRVDVVLNEVIKVNTDTLNPAKYVWSGGLSTVAVLGVDGNRIKLVTSDQTPGAVYGLTINP